MAYGADVDPNVLKFASGRISNRIGDLGDPRFLRLMCLTWPQMDVIIDDASHINWHQIQAFELLFPCLRPGGVYIVEDVDSSYKVRRRITRLARRPFSPSCSSAVIQRARRATPGYLLGDAIVGMSCRVRCARPSKAGSDRRSHSSNLQR